MEAEVVSMVVNLYHGGPKACGTMSSGGTESILLACLAYRNRAQDLYGITAPELVIPVTAHAAFDKAGGYFNIKIIHIPIDEQTRKVDLAALRRAITRNTIAVVGSAPSFPHGIIDDIQGIAQIAERAKVPLHVDCCLGGFLLPFMDKAGYPIAPFDFRIKAVTSISCDPHKFGFTPKGSSVIMYSDASIRNYQYFVQPNWPGGIYASPTLAGSRPGAIIAGCWATLMYFGEQGYIESTKSVIRSAQKIRDAIRNINGLIVFGNPEGPVVAFGSKEFDIYRLSTALTKRGWNLNSLQYPSSIHICCTTLTPKSDDLLIADLKELAAEFMRSPDVKADGNGAIYGLAQQVPTTFVDQMARGFLDILYKA